MQSITRTMCYMEEQQAPSRLKQIGILIVFLGILWALYSDRFAFSIPKTNEACIEVVENIQKQLTSDTSQGLLIRITNFIQIIKQNKLDNNEAVEPDPIITLIKLLRSKPDPDASVAAQTAFQTQVDIAIDQARTWCGTLPTKAVK